MARKKSSDGGGGPNWLDTYADMVTLLLTFFVLLFAMSSVDANKWTALVKAFSGADKLAELSNMDSVVVSDDGLDFDTSSGSGTPGNNVTKPEEVVDFDDLYYYLKYYVDAKGLQDSAGVHKDEDYTFIVFQNSIFFNGDSAVLRPDGKQLLDEISRALKNISEQIGVIRIYGHTAKVSEVVTPAQRAFDRTLSTERANNVLLYIDLKNIIDPAKLVAEGYGHYRPLVPHDGTEATRRKNRRVELYISKKGVSDDILEQIYDEINNPSKSESSR